MKKLTVLVIALIMSFSMFACNTSETPDPGTTSSNNGSATASEPPVSSEVAEETKTDSDGNGFEEIIVVDNSDCFIKVTQIDPDNMWGYTLGVYLENRSADKTYMFSVRSAAINGVDTDPLFATEVVAGKKSNEEITFSDTALQENDIGEFTDIELTFSVSDSEDWSAEPVAVPTVHIYPIGKENATMFTREVLPTDNIISDNDYATVIVTGYEVDEVWGYGVKFFLINKSDVPVMFAIEDASINGYMADPFYADSVGAGKCAFSTAYWSDTTLEENVIAEVESIEFTLRAYHSDDWMADDFIHETISLTP